MRFYANSTGQGNTADRWCARNKHHGQLQYSRGCYALSRVTERGGNTTGQLTTSPSVRFRRLPVLTTGDNNIDIYDRLGLLGNPTQSASARRIRRPHLSPGFTTCTRSGTNTGLCLRQQWPAGHTKAPSLLAALQGRNQTNGKSERSHCERLSLSRFNYKNDKEKTNTAQFRFSRRGSCRSEPRLGGSAMEEWRDLQLCATTR